MNKTTTVYANLYWVTSKDPENWFIVAPSKKIAAKCHENNEGLNNGNAKAELICEIPCELERKFRGGENDILGEGYWPSLDLLKSLGFEFIEKSPPYIVRRNGRVFYEGGSCSDLIVSNLVDRSGVYLVNIRGTNHYKIGFTKNIQRRLKEFMTNNPFAVDLHFFLLTDYPVVVERELHSILSSNRIVKEWFEIHDIEDFFSAIEKVSKNHEIKMINAQKYLGR